MAININALPPTFEEFATPAMCAKDGCSNRATFVLTAKLWAKGYPKETTSPLEIVVGLKCCADHREDIDPAVFWVPEGKAQIRQALAAIHRVEPDFDTSEFEWVPLPGSKLN